MSQRDIINLYSRPQHGGDLPYFVGRQYGGNWKQTLGRFALSLGRRFGVPLAKTLGSAALKTTSDVLFNKQPIKEAIKQNMAGTVSDIKKHAADTIKETIVDPLQNQGGGGRKRRRRIKHKGRKRKRLNQFGGGGPGSFPFKALNSRGRKRKHTTINKFNKVTIFDE